MFELNIEKYQFLKEVDTFLLINKLSFKLKKITNYHYNLNFMIK